MAIKFRAICSEAMRAKNGGVMRVLLTILSKRQPEYLLINLLDKRDEEFEAEATYRITIEKE